MADKPKKTKTKLVIEQAPALPQLIVGSVITAASAVMLLIVRVH